MYSFTLSFIYPTFTNYLMTNFGLSVVQSSIFFVISTASYFVVLHFINTISDRIGSLTTITLGIAIHFIGVMFLPPINILPKYLFIF
jgi:hypothetical protein